MNTSLDKLRKRKREQQLFNSNNIEINEFMFSLDSGSAYEEIQYIDFIKLLSSKLKGKQYAVFVLHDLEELTQAETSEVLEISRNSVKSNLHYARKAIRQLLITAEQQKISSRNEM